MPATTITGDMFSVTVDGPSAELRVWRRPDLDSETGTKNAMRLSEEGQKLAARGVRRVLLDVRDAPTVAGPKSIALIGAMLMSWANARMRIAVLVGETDALKVLQITRVIMENAPEYARLVKDPKEAAAWLAGAPGSGG